MNKVVVITGTSTGVGRALTIQMAEQGYNVVATMRDLKKSGNLEQELDKKNLQVSIMELDVQCATSIDKCINEVVQQYDKIDIFINNAGAGFIKTSEHATEDEIQWITDVNYMGVVRCTKAVLPYMRKARSGHIINITSVGGLVGQPFNEFYCAAKFAVEGYTEALASYVQPEFGIQFSLVEPGGIRSGFANSVLKQLESTGGMPDDEYFPVLQKYIGGSRERTDTGIYQSAEEVAEVVVSVSKSNNPPVRIRTSEWAESFSSYKTQADPSGLNQQKMVIENMLNN